MWGADVLKVEDIKTLIEECTVPDEEFSDDESTDEDDLQWQKKELFRFDCIVVLLFTTECAVVQNIFRTFPIAFPLIMPEINEENQFKVMIPVLTSPVIK